ncbi:hypothetical protein JCM3766R1_007146 [Sporobolomyces carnicolor]
MVRQGEVDARVTASSLDELEGELPIHLEPTDALGVVFALQVKPLLASNQGPPRMPSLVIVWRRSGSPESVSTTSVVPFPAVRQLPLVPRVTVRLPRTMTANAPTTLEYTVSNPTARTLHLATQIDPPSQPGSLAFAGPRHATGIVLGPRDATTVHVRIAPLVPGRLAIPNFRVYEVEQPPTTTTTTTASFDRDGRPIGTTDPPPRMRELETETEVTRDARPLVVVDVEPAAANREGRVREEEEAQDDDDDLGQARDGLARVVVVPSRSYPPEQ